MRNRNVNMMIGDKTLFFIHNQLYIIYRIFSYILQQKQTLNLKHNSGIQIAYQDKGFSFLKINPLGASWSINLQCGLFAAVEQFCEYKFRNKKGRPKNINTRGEQKQNYPIRMYPSTKKSLIQTWRDYMQQVDIDTDIDTSRPHK